MHYDRYKVNLRKLRKVDSEIISPCKNFTIACKKRAPKVDLSIYEIPLLFDFSLRLAPSITGVAVVSQILCISATLNKGRNIFFIYLNYLVLLGLSRNLAVFLQNNPLITASVFPKIKNKLFRASLLLSSSSFAFIK